MIDYTAAELSRIMWEVDPLHTCCNVNGGMEDEYIDVATAIVENSKTMSEEEAVRQAIILHWVDDYFYTKRKDELLKCLSYTKR